MADLCFSKGVLRANGPHLLEHAQLPAPSHERHVSARPHHLGLAQWDRVVALRHLHSMKGEETGGGGREAKRFY